MPSVFQPHSNAALQHCGVVSPWCGYYLTATLFALLMLLPSGYAGVTRCENSVSGSGMDSLAVMTASSSPWYQRGVCRFLIIRVRLYSKVVSHTSHVMLVNGTRSRISVLSLSSRRMSAKVDLEDTLGQHSDSGVEIRQQSLEEIASAAVMSGCDLDIYVRSETSVALVHPKPPTRSV